MTVWQSPEFDQHEQVCLFTDARTGARAVIAVHRATHGCAVGGTRCAKYDSDLAAIEDALRLSRAMSYKSAMAGLPFGGGKAVLLTDRATDRTQVLERYAGWLNSLGGRFCTAEDVGFSVHDCEYVRGLSPFVAGTNAGAGDPSRYTAQGVYQGMLAAIEVQLGCKSFEGVQVALQGVGSVGWHLCILLHQARAKLLVADTNKDRAVAAVRAFDAALVPVPEIAIADAEVFAPCALGRVISETLAAQVRARVIAGCANNQLASRRAGEILHERGILYAPDFVINSGGIISAAGEIAQILGSRFPLEESLERRVEAIHSRLLEIFQTSIKKGVPPEEIAERRAREILANHTN